MHTNGFTTATTNTDNTQSATQDPPSGKPSWPSWAARTLTWLTKTSKRVQRFVVADPTGAAALAGAALGVVLTAVLAISAVIKVVTWLVTGNPARDIAAQWPTVRIVTDPIGHWLSTHTTGLPLTATTAAWVWGVLGVLLFVAACHHHLGAQLLWPAYGTATAAMAWLGTAESTHRPMVVGLIAVAWSVLSLLALRRRPPARTVPVLPRTDRPRTIRPAGRAADHA